MTELASAIIALLESIQRDEARSGGLLSRETLRYAAELNIAAENASKRKRKPQGRAILPPREQCPVPDEPYVDVDQYPPPAR